MIPNGPKNFADSLGQSINPDSLESARQSADDTETIDFSRVN